MAEALLLLVANSILEKLTSNAFEELKVAKAAKKDLQKIAAKLPAICAVLEDAEKQQYSNAAIKVWLRGLKSVVYDINDLLDEVATDALQRTVNKGRKLDQLRYYLSSSNPLISRFDLSHKVSDLRIKIDSIVAQKNDFDLIQNLTQTPVFERNPFDACPDVGSSIVIGREEAKQDIINKLLKVGDDASCPAVLPIVGMGGLGKTALAKLVYQDLPAEFDIKLWACVTNTFDRTKIIGDLIKDATSDQYTSNQDLLCLVRKLRGVLGGKKYFIVLDDVWLEDMNIWTEFKSILEVGQPGSVVLVTTRLANVASITQTIGPAYDLNRLPTDVCWSIFKQLVFKEGEEQRYPNLFKIGSSIIEKCHGVPLVVKTLGGMLCNQRNELEWEQIDKMGSSEYGSVVGVLKLSYDRLPPYLKPCAATCSLFMKGEFHYHQNSTYYWSALGLLPTNRYDEIESAGHAYFMELMSRSFLQEPEIAYDGIVERIKMHDLFHDLALNIMGEELAVVTSDKLGISETCRHIIWDYEDLSDKKLPEGILKAEKAQTFRFGYRMGYVSQSIIEGIISNFSTLRILDLRDSLFEKLPSSIGNLKHLRVLQLSFNPIIRRLPKTICNLLNLQLLDISGCEQLEEVPKKMDKLVSLRTLAATTKQLSLSGTGITGLHNLHTLELAYCGELVSLWEDDDDVAAIGGLTSLRQCLIIDCPKVTHLPNNMKFLTALEKLSIHRCEALELEKGEGLCGLQSLRSLQIEGVPKLERLPDGLLQSITSSLQYLFIKDCEGLTELSDWFQQFVSLKRLCIYNCPKLVALPVGLAHLTSMKELDINNCMHLTERCAIPNGPDFSLIRHVPEIGLDGRSYKSKQPQ